MKLISLIGKDPLNILLPLTQLTNLIDGAYFLTTEAYYSMAERIKAWLLQWDRDVESPGWDQSIDIVVFEKQTGYQEIYSRIREIMDQEYRRNEEVAFINQGGNKTMQHAASFASREMLAPLLTVDTRLFRMQLSFLSWDRKAAARYDLPCVPMQLSLQTLLQLYGLNFTQNIPKNTTSGFRYEQKIYEAFADAKNNGKFTDVERNLIFTWNEASERKNEIDIVVMRKGVIGFISIKGGRSIRNADCFVREYKKIIQQYPDTLAGKPCLKMLICKEKIQSGRFIRMLANEIVAIDNVWADSQLQLAVELAAAGCDHIAKTGRPLPFDFYHRFISKQYGKWGNIIGGMRKGG